MALLEKSKILEEVALWIVSGLFAALAIAWATFPKIYLHAHPALP
ncbi:MAG: hypothetical protein ABSH39_06610 [Candidatus Acidiferrum sp.]|jgi:hypothetical protein